MTKLTVSINQGEVTLNGKRTTPVWDGNNGRHVYICGKYVIKVDDRGYDHDDMGTWKRIKPKDRRYFVPCLAQGYTAANVSWSIQPYVDLNYDGITDEIRGIVNDLVDTYDLSDIDMWGEKSPRNWAMCNGQPIIFDYGL